MNNNSEEGLKRLFKLAYPAVLAPAGFKECLDERLAIESNLWRERGRSNSGRLKIRLLIAIALICVVIGYGAWLSLNVSM